jgi:hypothetical protein
MINRKKFFDTVRESLFNGVLTQRQVDGMNYLLDAWEKYFEAAAGKQSIPWLSYAMATCHHETAYLHSPIEEYGKGSGKEYGETVPPHWVAYYGRGFVQCTWLSNYQKAEKILRETYHLECPCVEYPSRMLEHLPAALTMYDGLIGGWFTGAKLADFFNEKKEDPYEARTCVNGHDHASTIESYYWKFKEALAP